MAISLTSLISTNEISGFPAIYNANNTLVQNAINNAEAVLNPTTNKLLLTSLLGSVPTGGAEVGVLTATANSGTVLAVAPSGGANVWAVDSSGAITALKLTLTGTGVSNKSVLNNVDITGVTAITGNTSIDATLDLAQTNSRLVRKFNVVTVGSTMIGAAASSPLDIGRDYEVHLDYDNGGLALGGNADVRLDTSNLTAGQVLYLRCLRTNTTGQALYNGTSGAEIFATINPLGSGFEVVPHTSLPTFNPGVGTEESFLKVAWLDIGSSTFRLVILESSNVSNI